MLRSPSTASGPPRRGSGGGRRSGWNRLAVALVATVAGGAILGVGVASAIRVPNLDAYTQLRPGLITRLLDAEGQVFATYARERRQLIEEGQLPDILQNAVLSAEDAEFFRHGGVDLLGVVRTVAGNVIHGRRWGASTITMQLARALMGRREKTWDRKIAETLLAVDLEKTFSKQQILTMYCNLQYLGSGNYGMQSAALDYFGHGVDELALGEAATLAGILQRPSDYDPYRHPERAVARRNYVLRRMQEEGFIDAATRESASAAPLVLARRPPQKEVAPYFAEEVRQDLEREFGSDRLYEEGLHVRTTLDPAIQDAAERALREGLIELDRSRGYRGALAAGRSTLLSGEEIRGAAGRNPDPTTWFVGLTVDSSAASARLRTPDGELEVGPDAVAWTRRKAVSDVLREGDLNWFRRIETPPDAAGVPGQRIELVQEPQLEAAVLVLESATGAIRGLVGGWDFERSKFDRATQARRQVGSAFKPFVFGAAFESGFSPADTLFDAPVAFAGADGLPTYSPRNYYRRYHGILTLRRALELSVNVASVKLLDLVGVDRVVDFARRCGVTSPLPPYPSLALGSADLLPLELAAAYAAIANQGVAVRPYLVEEVWRPDGGVLRRHRTEATRAMEPSVAYLLTHVLEGVIDRGTGASMASIPASLAGKTGTTNDYTDAWFVGFTPRYTLLAWVGHDQKKTIGKRMTGARAALPIWQRLVDDGLANGWIRGDEGFLRPPGVDLRPVELDSGLAAVPGAPHVIEEAFLSGTAPRPPWEPRWSTILTLPWPQQQAFYEAREGETMPTEASIAVAEQDAVSEAEEAEEETAAEG